MAAIDFPASPTVGQQFTAGNGVIYVWNGLLWVAAGSAAPGGDFHATGLPTAGINNASAIVAIFPTVLVGNAGGWYNISTGRFTPPAGRYELSAGLSYYSSTAAMNMLIQFRKNGVSISGASSLSSSAATNYRGQVCVDAIVDANGTDYFDLVAQSGVGGGPTPSDIVASWFNAFPISGIKGPPGDVGSLGQTIRCLFGGGALTAPGWTTPGYTVLSNDTGVAPVGSISWTPPAGRWAFNANVNIEGSAGGTYILSCTNTSQRGYCYTPTNGFVHTAAIADVLDFNGSTALTFEVYASAAANAYAAVPHFWSAHRVK